MRGSSRRSWVPVMMLRPRLDAFSAVCITAVGAGDVDGDRLFHEQVLACVHDRGHVHRAEVRGCRVEHDVDARVEELLVTVESGEALRFRDVLAALLHQASGLFQAILEHVGERDDLEVGSGVEEVRGGAAATAAAAYQSSSEKRTVRSAWRRVGSALPTPVPAPRAVSPILRPPRQLQPPSPSR